MSVGLAVSILRSISRKSARCPGTRLPNFFSAKPAKAACRVKPSRAASKLTFCSGIQPPAGSPLASCRDMAAAMPGKGLGLSTGTSEPNASGTLLSSIAFQA